VDIEIHSDGPRTTVKIDGEIEYGISGIEYSLDANVLAPPKVTLHVLVNEITYVARGAEVHLPEETVALLKKLGWKEPEK
jgi:hypothetical protein